MRHNVFSSFSGSGRRRLGGFSLISMVVAMAIMAVVGMGLSSLLRDAFRGQRTVASRAERADLYSDVSRVLRSTSLCANGLLSSVGPPGTLITIRPQGAAQPAAPGTQIAVEGIRIFNNLGTSLPIATRAQPFGTTGFNVGNMALTVTAGASQGGGFRYKARFSLPLVATQNLQERQFDGVGTTRGWDLIVDTNAAGVITSCSVTGEDQAPDCAPGNVWGKREGSNQMECIPISELRGQGNFLSRTQLPPGITTKTQQQIWPTSCITATGPVPCGYQSKKVPMSKSKSDNAPLVNRRCAYIDGEWRSSQGDKKYFNKQCSEGIEYSMYEKVEEGSMTLSDRIKSSNLTEQQADALLKEGIQMCRIEVSPQQRIWAACNGRCDRDPEESNKKNYKFRFKLGKKYDCTHVKTGPHPPGYLEMTPEGADD